MTKTKAIGSFVSVGIFICLVFAVAGCVERRLTINTNPQGALVYLNDEEIGTTPVATSFNWYGDYRVYIVKSGYEVLNTHRKLNRPLHDYFILDFFAEVLWPGKIKDYYEWSFALSIRQPVKTEELLKSCNQLKATAQQELEEGNK